jgi:hypothetical protein
LGVLRNLFSGTFEQFCQPVSKHIVEVSLGDIALFPIKHTRNPLRKGLEVHPTAEFNATVK